MVQGEDEYGPTGPGWEQMDESERQEWVERKITHEDLQDMKEEQ